MALQVWLPLNGDLKNKGCADVTFAQSNLTYTSGKIGQCAYFNNIKTNTVTVPALQEATKFSISLWIKIPSNQEITNWSDVITFGCKLNTYSSFFRLEQTTAHNTLCWFGNNIFTNDSGVGYYPENIRNDTWYYLALTCDGQKMYEYWNGSLLREYEISQEFIGACLTGTMSIGDVGSYCYLNDIRVYNHCLSAVEVKEISRGLVLHYKLDDDSVEPTINYGKLWDESKIIATVSSDMISDWKIEKLDENTLKITALVDNPSYSTYGDICRISGYILVPAGTACTLSCEIIDFKGSLSRIYPCSGGFGTLVGYGTYENRVYRTITHTVNWTHDLRIRTSNQSEIKAGDYLIIKDTQIEIKDHPTSYTKTFRNENIVLDSSGYGNNGTINNGNLITGINRGGQTTVENGVVTTSGIDKDTYFNLLMSESLVPGTTYTISCIAENLPDGGIWRFPIANQRNTSLIFEINKNGLNTYTFTMNDFDEIGENQCFMDDVVRTAYQNQCKFYNWRIEKVDKQILSTELNSPRYDRCFKWSGNCDVYVKNPLYVTTTTEVQALTVALWYKSSSSNSSYHTLTSNRYPYSGFWLSTNCEGSPLWFYRGALYVYGKNVTISNDRWYHIALTWDGTNYQFYLNGNPVATTIYNSHNYTYIGPYFQEYLSVGGNRNGNTEGSSSDYRDYGSTSDFRLYATALSAEDVKQLYEVSAKIDKLGNLHSYEFDESHVGRELLVKNITNGYTSTTSTYTNYSEEGIEFNGQSSAGSEYIEINPSTNKYIYDYTISVSTGNQFYIGFERYDENKTARSNQACVYTFAQKPTSDIVKKRYTGVVNLATDGVNPCKYIRLRILNGWTGTDSSSTKLATIHNLSLREIPTSTTAKTKLYKTGIFESDLLLEGNTKVEIEKNLDTNVNQLIEM